MFSSLKMIFKWNSSKPSESNISKKSLLLIAFTNALQDVLFWNNLWLSLLFILYFHITFIALFYRQFNILQIICGFSILIVCVDAFEAWLKYKHRTTCLKRLAQNGNNQLSQSLFRVSQWINKQCINYIELRENNPTKAFLLMEIMFGMIFIIGRYTNGYILTYLFSMLLIFLNKLIPPLKRVINRLRQTAESDFELEGLVPDASAENLDLLSIEPEIQIMFDEKQSLDYWKPEDLPIEDASDSSDNSSSLVTNLSMEKLQTLDKDVDVTDSSEEEYIPEGQHEKFRSSMEVQPVGSWSSSAYNALSALGGAVSNIVYSSNSEIKRKRVSSVDSSDGFEMVDKNDIL
ncbi:uncharacterized protein LOC119835023 [Zerene cesonia]|uniref:uncharacterized protein LOC119835023 n=1 Tax=Zerene cesonia TaxID=33412 RepID=UPI0018E59909|nr:uncharacterized protein LOC119835023 [Zerene cesonia]